MAASWTVMEGLVRKEGRVWGRRRRVIGGGERAEGVGEEAADVAEAEDVDSVHCVVWWRPRMWILSVNMSRRRRWGSGRSVATPPLPGGRKGDRTVATTSPWDHRNSSKRRCPYIDWHGGGGGNPTSPSRKAPGQKSLGRLRGGDCTSPRAIPVSITGCMQEPKCRESTPLALSHPPATAKMSL